MRERENKQLERRRDREDDHFRAQLDRAQDRERDKLERRRDRDYAPIEKALEAGTLSDAEEKERSAAIEEKYKKLRTELDARLEQEYKQELDRYLAGKETERAAEDAAIKKRRAAVDDAIGNKREAEDDAPDKFAEIAPAGTDGQKALQLLSASKKLGAATLGTITAKALRRRLAGGPLAFSDVERRQLQKAMAATTATAELLGRARIRRRQEQAEEHHAPAIAKHAEERPYRVRLINSTEFRSKSLAQQEFGLWATVYDFPDAIPAGEVWIDDEVSKTDQRYFLFNAEAVRRARHGGMDDDDAADYGLAAERAERERERLGGAGIRPYHSDVQQDIYSRLWKVLEQDGERIKVYFVNGQTVRERYKTDWFEGGHAYVYPWIPEDEIWIEAGMRPAEQAFTLRHEFHERRKMKHEELGYDEAHDEASRVEFASRQKAESFAEAADFSEVATDFSCFDETAGPLRPLAPADAVNYFRRLVPRLNIDIAAFNGHIDGESFRMAQATEQQVLERCQEVIGKILEKGEGLANAPRQVDEILHEAGIHPRNPQYAEMVVRTNLMNAYNRGSHDELQEVADDFPWYRYVGIRDGRQRKRHEKWFDKYFTAAVPFEEVRDHEAGEFDGFNCRCGIQPIYKAQVLQLKARGVQAVEWPAAA